MSLKNTGHLPESLAKLSPERRALLALLLRKRAGEPPVKPPIPRLERAAEQNCFPVSFAQQRLWVIDQLEPGNIAYNILTAFHIDGPVDLEALESSFNQVILRHETLRTSFQTLDGRPVQVIAPASPLAVRLVDLTNLPGIDSKSEVERRVVKEAREPFDLARGPLLRVCLLRLAEHEHVLAITIHHIICDGWSTGLLLREVAALYQAFNRGEPSPLAELPIQYADFAVWQRQRMEGDLLQAQLSYWKHQLDGVPVLQLLTDRPRPPVQTFGGRRYTFALPSSLTERLNVLSSTEGVTLFMTLLGAFQTLLYRYTAQSDVPVGSVVANRTRSELEPLIGFFVNTLVLRTAFASDLSVRDMLQRVKQVCVGAFEHQDLPFEKLVEELHVERDPSRSALFQVMFILQNAFVDSIQAASLEPTPLHFDTATVKFDLVLNFSESGRQLIGTLEYNTDLFDAPTIDRFAGHLRTVMEAMVASPHLRLSALPLLSSAELRQLLVQWNDAAASYSLDSCMHVLIERQVELTPDAVAVIFEDQQLTYRELNARANQLAHHLRRRGIVREALVGICLERGLEMITAVIAVFKAGAAYVPLDPAYPKERLAYMLEDARSRLLLTTERLREQLPKGAEAAICLDSHWEEIAGESTSDPAGEAFPDSLAYVIYTSGSTGKPKGVMVSHRSMNNLVLWMKQAFGVTGDDKMLQKTPFSFDPSVWEFFLPLVSGGTLVMAEPGGHLDGAYMLRETAQRKVTILQLVPSMLQMLLQEDGLERCQSLRLVFSGAEALPIDLIEKFYERLSSDLHNVYGPTEAAMHVTVWPCPREPLRQAVAIGRPVGNTRIYTVDAHMQPMPVGAAGELLIGGVQLARGYMNCADLTAASFIPDPSSPDGGARLYRTGDLARYMGDGNIQFLGRIDNQVKIRGFRIELGEIEAAIGEHPAVEKVAVLTTAGAANKRLVAYVVAAAGAQSTAKQLKEFVRAKLPEYMVPFAFVLMDSFPLTASGKLDRRSLPAPEEAGFESAEILEAPRNDIEERLAGIWSEVLGVPAIGINDNFFDLGGHSLLAIQLMSRVREAFHTDVPISRLFESPTVARLAAAIVQQKASQAEPTGPLSLPFITPSKDERLLPFPLTDVQQAYWVGRSGSFELSNVSAHSYVEIEGDKLDLERLSLVWQLLIERHDMLRAIMLPDGQQQILAHVPPYRIEVLDLSRESEESIASQLDAIRKRMSHQVLRSDQWPIFEIRATLFSGNRIRVHVSLDALLLDGWSAEILGRELVRLYGDPHLELPHLELSFRDYVIATVALKETEVYKQSLDYWLSLLPSMPPAPELPLTIDPGAIRRPEFKRRRTRLEPAAWLRIKSRAAQAGLTPSGVLCAAYSEIIAAWSKSPRFTINLTLFNRPPMHPQINDIVGDFTSLTLLAVDLHGADSFAARAQRLQHRLWNDLDHRYVSGVRLLRELARTRRESAGAAFPIVFTSVLTLPSNQQEAKALSLPVEVIYSISQTPQVWLDHIVSEREGALNLTWDAVDELFPAGFLDDMFAAYCDFLGRLADDERAWQEPPRQLVPVAQIEQRDAINATQAPAPEGLLHTSFVKQARLRPSRAAVVSSSRSLSYEELLSLSTRFARRLRERGARPNMLVAIVMEKGWEQVVAALAILQSGAAYLPIDAGLPSERLWHLLQDGSVTLVLTQPWLDQSLEWPETVERFCVDGEDLDDAECLELEPAQSQHDLAYVIYTSGSTGQPKGVMIDHRGAVNTIIDINQRFEIGPDDRVLALSSLSFDLSVYDIFGTLAAGGTIIIPEAWAARDPHRWAELIAENQVTIWNSVPTLMEMLVDYSSGAGEQSLATLRLILLSGDWIPVSLPDRIKALVDGVRIVSLGGATEASIWSILYEIAQVDPQWKSIPYGKPMVNQSFHIFNSCMEPCPVWVTGELHIGGLGLAKGYWQDAEKTDARFITHPRTGERLYRTGDLGRYLPDGNIAFLGREDFQVKIRGHRIELGEIEATLTTHPSVKEGIVMARDGARGGKRLVAYVVPREGFVPAVSELQDFLERKLPEFMIPSAFVILKALPLTSNGKLDRQALLDVEQAGQESEHTFVAARTEVELKLAAAWREVFGRDAVGIYDNFFELGGDSILAIRIISKASQAGLILTPKELFECQTIAALAEAVAGTDGKAIEESHMASERVTFGWSEADLDSIAAAINESMGED